MLAPANGLVLAREPFLRTQVPECDSTAARRQFDAPICQQSRVSEQPWSRLSSLGPSGVCLFLYTIMQVPEFAQTDKHFTLA